MAKAKVQSEVKQAGACFLETLLLFVVMNRGHLNTKVIGKDDPDTVTGKLTYIYGQSGELRFFLEGFRWSFTLMNIEKVTIESEKGLPQLCEIRLK